MMWWCTVMVGLALGQQDTDEGPLAIPVDEAPPATRQPKGATPAQTEDGRPLALPPDATGRPRPPEPPRALAASAQLARALRTYERKALSVRPVTDFSVRTAAVAGWGPGWGWGPYWGGWYGVPVVDAQQGWAIFEGDHRLDVPTALDKLGDTPLRVQLEGRMRRARTAGSVWTGLGVAGIVGGLVGIVGLDQSRTYAEARTWSTVATASSLVGIGGLVVGSFPSSKARRLAVDPSWTLSRDDAEERAESVNGALAAELGIPEARRPR